MLAQFCVLRGRLPLEICGYDELLLARRFLAARLFLFPFLFGDGAFSSARLRTNTPPRFPGCGTGLSFGSSFSFLGGDDASGRAELCPGQARRVAVKCARAELLIPLALFLELRESPFSEGEVFFGCLCPKEEGLEDMLVVAPLEGRVDQERLGGHVLRERTDARFDILLHRNSTSDGTNDVTKLRPVVPSLKRGTETDSHYFKQLDASDRKDMGTSDGRLNRHCRQTNDVHFRYEQRMGILGKNDG